MGTFTHLHRIWSPRLLSVLRIVVALLYMQHGAQKLFGFPPMPQPMTIAMFSQFWFAGIIEFFGGLFMLFGLFTRVAAFITSGEMAVAYFQGHASQGFLPIMNRGELAVLYCFVFLYIWMAGGGAWSLDNKIRRRKAERIYR